MREERAKDCKSRTMRFQNWHTFARTVLVPSLNLRFTFGFVRCFSRRRGNRTCLFLFPLSFLNNVHYCFQLYYCRTLRHASCIFHAFSPRRFSHSFFFYRIPRTPPFARSLATEWRHCFLSHRPKNFQLCIYILRTPVHIFLPLHLSARIANFEIHRVRRFISR